MSKRLVLTAAAAALATFASALDAASVHSTAAASAVASHHSHHENQHLQHSVAHGSHASAAAASTVASAAASHGHPSHQGGGSHVASSHAVASSHHVVSSHVVGSHPQSGSAAAIAATDKEKEKQQLETVKPTEKPVEIPFTVSEETFLKTLDAWREKQFYGDASAPATPAVASATSAAGSGSKRHADASGTAAPGSAPASGHASQTAAGSHARSSGSHAAVGSHSAAAVSHDGASVKPQVLGRATAKEQAALEKETSAATIRVYFVANVTNFNDQLTGDAPFPTEKPTLGNFLATSSGQSAGRAASGGVQLASISGSAGVASSGAVARAERSKIKAAFAHIFDGSKQSEKRTPRSSAVRPQAASGGADFLPQTGGDAAMNARTPAHRTAPLTPQRKLALLLEWEKSLNQNQKGGHHQRKPSMMDRLVSPKHLTEQRSGLTLQSQRSAAASTTPDPDVPTPPSKFFFAAPRGAASAASATSGQQAAPTTIVLARGEKLMSLFDACSADSKRLCQNANPHQETMCLQLHARSLSGQCREYHTAKVFCAMQLHRLGVCDETQPGLGMCIAMNIRHRLLGGTCTNTKYAMYLRMKLTKGGD